MTLEEREFEQKVDENGGANLDSAATPSSLPRFRESELNDNIGYFIKKVSRGQQSLSKTGGCSEINLDNSNTLVQSDDKDGLVVPEESKQVTSYDVLSNTNIEDSQGQPSVSEIGGYADITSHNTLLQSNNLASKLESNCLATPTRYTVAVHRIRDVERSQNPREQLSWAGNEMASIIREGDSVLIEPPLAWAGLAMVHKAQHEIAAGFDVEQHELVEVEERALYSLKQVKKALKGVRVEFSHREYVRRYKVLSISTQPMSQLTLFLWDPRDYYCSRQWKVNARSGLIEEMTKS